MPLDLSVCLSVWAAGRGLGGDLVGNVEPVAGMQNLSLCQQERLLQAFEQAFTIFENARAEQDAQNHIYAPLPLTLATYVLAGIVWLPETEDAMLRELRSRTGDELLRYKIKVIRDALNLSRLVKCRGLWVQNLIPNSDPYKQRDLGVDFRWLAEPRTEFFCTQSGEKPLTGSEETTLDNLWRLFDGNRWLPIRVAFCLARLNPEEDQPDDWLELSQTLWPVYISIM